MKLEDMEAAINKLRYQVRILGEAIDYKTSPVESLILSMDWSKDDINRVHDIFERWDTRIRKGEKLESHKFESEFDSVGIGYQALKSVILAFYRNGQWTDVCEAYVDSFGGTPSLEYHGIMKRERD